MADDHVGGVLARVVEGDADFFEEEVSRLAHDHGGEELAAQPGAAAWRDGLLDDGDVDGGVLGELVGAGEPGGARADDDHVGVGVRDHVGHVAPRHFSGDDRFLDRLKLEFGEVDRLGVERGADGDVAAAEGAGSGAAEFRGGERRGGRHGCHCFERVAERKRGGVRDSRCCGGDK